MAGNRVAVVGVGQTHHRARARTWSMAGMVREAAAEALEDAHMTWSDIDAVVIGKAPDMFEGVAMPELYLADALGAVGKPMMRVHNRRFGRRLDVDRRGQARRGGRARARAHRRVREAVGEQRDVGLSVPMPFSGAARPRARVATFAPLIRAYMYARARRATRDTWSR